MQHVFDKFSTKFLKKFSLMDSKRCAARLNEVNIALRASRFVHRATAFDENEHRSRTCRAPCRDCAIVSSSSYGP
jgi:hypothetical protein